MTIAGFKYMVRCCLTSGAQTVKGRTRMSNALGARGGVDEKQKNGGLQLWPPFRSWGFSGFELAGASITDVVAVEVELEDMEEVEKRRKLRAKQRRLRLEARTRRL